jgi:site-specific DNA-methyltransferase (adenine-specific)
MINIEDAGFELWDCLMWLHGNGHGTHLKPAWEPIVLAQKPRDGTYADNIRIWGVGGLNIANCMLSGRDKAKFPVGDYANPGMYGVGGHRDGDANPDARFPANVLLTHHPECEEVANGCHPDCPIGLLNEQAGQEASRFYYCGRASAKERHLGLDGEKNDHPCVKPLGLCEYLARLLLPLDQGRRGTLVIPYAGTGSEMIGAMLAGWADIRGIEINPHYADIAKKRIRYWRENNNPGLLEAKPPIAVPNLPQIAIATSEDDNSDLAAGRTAWSLNR